MGKREEYKKRIIDLSSERGDFVQMEDGYYVFWPTSQHRGFITAVELRILAQHLDDLNREWDEQVRKDLSEKL